MSHWLSLCQCSVMHFFPVRSKGYFNYFPLPVRIKIACSVMQRTSECMYIAFFYSHLAMIIIKCQLSTNYSKYTYTQTHMHTRERKKNQFSRNCPRTVMAIAMVNNGRHNRTMQVTHVRKKQMGKSPESAARMFVINPV